jgi:hypothetical protein
VADGQAGKAFRFSISLSGIAGLTGMSIFKVGLHTPELDATNLSSLVFVGVPTLAISIGISRKSPFLRRWHDFYVYGNGAGLSSV